MSELDGILRTATEAHDIDLSSLYGFAGPLAKTACHHSMGTGAMLVHHNMFLTRVGALGMWPQGARESLQGGCMYCALRLTREWGSQ